MFRKKNENFYRTDFSEEKKRLPNLLAGWNSLDGRPCHKAYAQDVISYVYAADVKLRALKMDKNIGIQDKAVSSLADITTATALCLYYSYIIASLPPFTRDLGGV